MKDYSLKINGQSYKVQIDEINETSTMACVTVNGTPYEVEIAGAKGAAVKRPQVTPAPVDANCATVTPVTAAPTPRINAAHASTGHEFKSPLPGTVLGVKVSVGDRVAPGQTLVVLEAMKMENNIDADRAGVVKEVFVQQGATVMEGDKLLTIE